MRTRNRAWRVLALTVFGASIPVLAAGCAAPPRVTVPKDAQLLWYGNSPFDVQYPTPTAGELYLYDESDGRVASVMHVNANQHVQFNGMEKGHYYRLYFLPGFVPAPATRPSGS